MYALAITTSVLNLMFFVSGVDKVAHFNKVVTGLQNRLGSVTLPVTLVRLMIGCAIVIELVAPMVILKASLDRSQRNDRLATYASASLVVFTVLATLLYHFPPSTSAKYYPFMSNLSAVGGLSLMGCVFHWNLLK